MDPAITKLLAGPLDSFEKLDVAMALHRSPAQTLSLEEIARQVTLTRDQIKQAIEELIASRLVSSAGGLVRLTVQPTNQAAFAALADTYERDRAEVAQAMSEVAMDKIRGMAARTFGEALAGRKRDDG